MQKVKDYYNRNFIFKKQEKLSKLGILLIILLNIFIFSTIHIGTEFYIKILNHPSLYYPRQCQNILTSKKLENFNNYFYSYINTNINKEIIDNRCDDLINLKLIKIQENNNIQKLIKKDKEIDKKYVYMTTKLNSLYSRHGKIILSEPGSAIVDIDYDIKQIKVIQAEYTFYKNEIRKIEKEKSDLAKNFKNSSAMSELTEYVTKNKKEILTDHTSLIKMYEFKKEIIVLLFKIPLILILYLMMKKYLRKRNYVLFVLFKSVLYAMIIPIVIAMIIIFKMLIPNNLFYTIVNKLNDVEIHFLVYYLAIAIFLFVFGNLIEKLQNRYNKKTRNCKSNNISKVVLHKCDDK